jgi:PHP family Zn ribbon phosphoesterase
VINALKTKLYIACPGGGKKGKIIVKRNPMARKPKTCGNNSIVLWK